MNADASMDWTCTCGTANPTFDPWCSACNEPRLEQPEAQAPARAYGIIDPDYARVFTIARCLAWSEGYSLAMQGSFTRDLDLLAVPWTAAACEPEHLARRIEDAADLKSIVTPTAGEKPHGRLAWTLSFKGFGDPRFVDLSIMPRLAATPVANGAGVGVDGRATVPVRLSALHVSEIKDMIEADYNIYDAKARPLWASLLQIVAGLSIEQQEAINEQRAALAGKDGA